MQQSENGSKKKNKTKKTQLYIKALNKLMLKLQNIYTVLLHTLSLVLCSEVYGV